MLPLIVIYGPTACGKTALSLEIAQRRSGEIISADSRQIYRGLDIGTGKIRPHEMIGIRHHMIDILDIGTPYSVAQYRDAAASLIAEIHARGNTPILCGGTGLWIDAIIFGHFTPLGEPNWAFRAELETKAKNEGNLSVWNLLNTQDPEYAQELHHNNLPYIIRALEVLHTTGVSKRAARIPRTLQYQIEWHTPYDGQRDILYKKIDERVQKMFDDGLIEEVEGLVDRGYSIETFGLNTIGYTEVFDFLQKKTSISECCARVQQNSRRYAKRQLTWFGRYSQYR